MKTEIHLRAGDADREATADHLRRGHSEGRLDSDEFATRIDRCYDAKTIGELEQLVADLPPARVTHSATPVQHSATPVRRIGMFQAMWLLPLLFAAVATVAHSGFWMVLPLLFIVRFWVVATVATVSASPSRTAPGSSNPAVNPERQRLGRVDACAVVE